MNKITNAIVLGVLVIFGLVAYKIYNLFAPQKNSETKGSAIVQQYKVDHLNDHNIIYWWVYDKIHGTGVKK